MTSNNSFILITFAREQKRTDQGQTAKLSPKVLMWRNSRLKYRGRNSLKYLKNYKDLMTTTLNCQNVPYIVEEVQHNNSLTPRRGNENKIRNN